MNLTIELATLKPLAGCVARPGDAQHHSASVLNQNHRVSNPQPVSRMLGQATAEPLGLGSDDLCWQVLKVGREREREILDTEIDR